jgi:hypothetical protein
LALVAFASLRAAEPVGARPIITGNAGGSSTSLPGKPIDIQVGTGDNSALSVDVYSVDVPTYLTLLRRDYHGPNDFGTKAVRHAIQAAATTQNSYFNHRIELASLPIGLYAIRVISGRRNSVSMLNVTTLGAFVLSGPQNDALYAIDLRSFHKRADVTFDSTAGSAPSSSAASSDGLAIFDRTAGGEAARYVARAGDGSVTFSGDVSRPQPPQRNGFLQLDRPLYRPGDTVSYRLIERDGAPGSFALPSGDVDVNITGPDGKTVFSAKRPYGAYGSASGDYALPTDAALGRYTVFDGDRSYGTFTVAAYVKPEYVVDVAPRHPGGVVGGDAAVFAVKSRYLFGRPAAGLKLHYRASFRPRYRPWYGRFISFRFSDYHGTPDAPVPDVTGDLIAGRDGTATISIPTERVSAARDLQLDVDGRDASGKTVTVGASVPVTPASFELEVSFDTYFAARNDTVNVTVRSVTASGTPQPHIPVRVWFSQRTWDSEGTHDTPIGEDEDVVTDAAGVAHLTWHAAAAGYIDVTARAQDERGNDAVADGYLWVSDAKYPWAYRFESTTVSAQKATYAPGERPRVLVAAPQADVDALVSVSSGGHDQLFVQHLDTFASTFDVDPPAGVAKFGVTVWVPTAQGFSMGQTTIEVAPAPHKLTVAIHPGKAKYEPGERAQFALEVRDQSGRPAQAEIGVGIVDDGVLALAPEDNADPFDALYGSNVFARSAQPTWYGLDQTIALYPWALQSIARVSARNLGGAFQPAGTIDQFTVAGAMPAPTPAPAAPSFANLRSDFRDTAYWTPAVVTDGTGRATVSFAWPDNLTTYTTTGVAVTQATDIGSGTGKTLVSKDFLVRLSTPRFMRRDDVARITVTAQGVPGAKTALLRFSAPALGIGNNTVEATFDSSASATTSWNVAAASGVGPSFLRLAGTSGALSDGLERTFPIESDGVAEHERAAGSLPKDPELALVLPKGADAGDLKIDLAPSVVAQLIGDVRLLDVYPYGCVEQTMSAALPAIDVGHMAARMHVPAPPGLNPATVAKHAIARLGQLQHDDGSWGWWEHDNPNPFMTAYALYGLTELRRDHNTVPDEMFARGVASLKSQITSNEDTLALWGGPQPNSMWNTRAYMFFALADAAPQEVDRKGLAAVDAQAKTLNPYALAVLGLAHLEIDDRSGAEPLLAELGHRATDAGAFTHWSGGGWHYRWEDDPIETTAYALRFFHEMAPADPRVARTIAWLRTQAHGSWWYTTKDTAAAIYALTESLDLDPAEFAPNENVRVLLGDRVLRSFEITSTTLARDQGSIDVPASVIAKGGTLRFERSGTGSLYWSTDWTRYVRDGTPVASEIDLHDATSLDADTTPPFTVVRRYTAPSDTPWRLGDQIDVDVTVSATHDTQFVAVEDPLPAGLEYQPRLHEMGDDWSGLQFFDDRVVFFAANVWKNSPLHLHYRLRASTAGTFTAAPPDAYAMYGPPVASIGHAQPVTILP